MPIPATQFIWFNGKLVPWEKATVHVLSHALHYGSSVFEGVRAYETPRGVAIFRLRDHTRRLFDSAKIYRINIDRKSTRLNSSHSQISYAVFCLTKQTGGMYHISHRATADGPDEPLAPPLPRHRTFCQSHLPHVVGYLTGLDHPTLAFLSLHL